MVSRAVPLISAGARPSTAQIPELNAQAPQLVSGLKGVLEVGEGVLWVVFIFLLMCETAVNCIQGWFLKNGHEKGSSKDIAKWRFHFGVQISTA